MNARKDERSYDQREPGVDVREDAREEYTTYLEVDSEAGVDPEAEREAELQPAEPSEPPKRKRRWRNQPSPRERAPSE